MISRRDFLMASLATLAVAGSSRLAWADGSPTVGLQLYSVRKQVKHDLAGVLAKVKQIGYDEVETYWNLYSHPAPELRRMIDDAGLRIPSGHFDYEKVERSFGYAHDLGLKYMVCPMLPKKMQNDSLDAFKQAAEQFNRWGEQAQKAGLRFAFHNHNYEFQKLGITTGYETLVANTDPKLVWFEMDCYWVTQAGKDPVEMLTSLGPRARMLHIKDRMRGVPTSQKLGKAADHFTEVGTGTLDFKAIAAVARSVGVEHYFVEQDEISKPVFESLTTSVQNAKRLLGE